MAELLTAEEMRRLETDAIAQGTVTGRQLMERAGQAVVEAIFERWRQLSQVSGTAIIFCGPGNNGGDGYVIARLFHEWGWDVRVFSYGGSDRLPPDARHNHDRWRDVGGVAGLSDFDAAEMEITRETVFVDALFGTGLTRALPPEVEALLAQLTLITGVTGAPMVAVDMPSGVETDSGRALGSAQCFADITVTFHRAKRGHYLGDGPARCGAVVIKDIGLTDNKTAGALHLVQQPPLNLEKSDGHKFSHGHALILSGGAGRTGAARLSARAALRIGAGLVTLGVPQNTLSEVAAQITALMMVEVNSPDDLRNILNDPRINALCVGPGFGIGKMQSAILTEAMQAGRPTVLDADALTLLAEDPEIAAQLHSNCVLTPHMGEFARLVPDLADQIATDDLSKCDAATQAAARMGACVLLKGPDTVIASPDGRLSVHASVYDRAAPWLATAGSGDVLAGLIAGLMARGFHSHQSAETAAWLHTEAAITFGPGLIAEDLPEVIPKVLTKLNA